MYCIETNRMKKALLLRREIIGVRFLYFKHEYDQLDVESYTSKTSYCLMVKKAMGGKHFKASKDHFACRCALEALGLGEEMPCVESGERYYSIKLHESRSVARAVTQNIARIRQQIYGIEIGPLEMLEEVDVVIFMVDGFQLMRVVEGHAYKIGTPKDFLMNGNQGVCADLTAAPFIKNGMNISPLCSGTRKMCKWENDEMGVGMPIQLFPTIVDGVLKTLNYIEYPDRKQMIRNGLSDPNELGLEIDDKLHYGKLGKEYCNPDRYQKLVNGEME